MTKCSDIVIPALRVNPEVALANVVAVLDEAKAAGLLVGEGNEIRGVVSRNQFAQPEVFNHPELTANDIMCTDFPIVYPEDDLHKIWNSSFEVLPVFEGDTLIGMVTRKAAGRALFREYARIAKMLEAVVNSASNGIVAIDADGIITTFNKAAEKYTWRKQEEAIGRYLADVVIPTGLLDVVRTGEKQFDFKIEAFHRIYVSNRSPIIEDGKVIGAVGVFQDISELEEVSHELRMLSQLNEELATIIDSSFDGIVVTDEVGAIVRANTAASRLLKCKPEDLPGRFVDDLLELPSPTISEEIMNKRKAVTRELPDRHLLLTGNPVFREDGSLRRVVYNLRDLSILHKLRDELKTNRILTHQYKQELANLRKNSESNLIAHSPKMLAVLELARRVASVESSVFISGESGVGKEVIANFIHEQSKRCHGPFIKVNCAAIPEALLESELFGYEGGAFTGSRKEGKPGLLELANNGTLLLDEVGDLPLSLQSKLLRVIQQGEFMRLGGSQVRKVNIRLISATNRNITEMISQGLFREDLFFRLHVVPIEIPPLRERPADILPLVYHFRNKVLEKNGLEKDFDPEVLKWFLQEKWPGNVRQLANTVERLLVTCPGPTVTIADLPTEAAIRSPAIQVNAILPLKEAGSEVERQILRLALNQTRNTYELAELLGVNQSTIVRKLQHLGLKD